MTRPTASSGKIQFCQELLHEKQSKMSLKYRPEIDGLRAIAVLAVVFYHAEVVFCGINPFKGGYIGVDVFFVISGYLITSIIIGDLKDGRFSLVNFYERRARRILPVLFTVMISSIPLAWVYLLPKAMKEYAGSLLSSLFFASNFWFWREDSYWAEPSTLKPFLHTWSLSVEEQFYLFFPLFLVLLWKFTSKYIAQVFFLAGVLSLLLSEFFTQKLPDFTFFLLPARGWELLAGAVLAQLEIDYGRSRLPCIDRLAPAVGICLIVSSIVLFDNQSAHPSFLTVYPILGTMLIIWFARSGELVTDILSSKPMVAIGLISYSLYLWHYTVFVFGRIHLSTPSVFAKFEWIAIAMILSVISFFVIEKPIRKREIISRKSFSLILFCGFSSVFLFAAIEYYQNGSPGRLGFNPDLLASFTRGDPDRECEDNKVMIEGVEWCGFGDNEKSTIDFILIGDSHSYSQFGVLNNLGEKYNKRGIYARQSGCPALVGVFPERKKEGQGALCHQINNAALEIAKNNQSVTLFLISRWDYYVDGLNTGDHNLINTTNGEFSKEGSREAFKTAVRDTFNKYSKTTADLVLLMQPPHQKENPLKMYKNIMANIKDLKNIRRIQQEIERSIHDNSVSIIEHQRRQSLVNSMIVPASKTYGNVTIIDPTDIFCDEICRYGDSKSSYYFDDDHLSIAGSILLSNRFEEFLK